MNWASVFESYWRELLVLLVITIAASLFWLYWPKRTVNRLPIPDAKERANVEDNFRKTAGQFIGGAAVLLGAGFAYLQFQQQQQQFQDQQRASRDLLISNQMSKGFEQLGSDKVEIRLGGIYSLEAVMNTSAEYYVPALEALCAFVRDRTRNGIGKGPPLTDIQAGLTVIGRRMVRDVKPNLEDAHIPKANLSGANLSGTNLFRINLSDANLTGANLSYARLTLANLSNAHLQDASLSGAGLGHANLSGIYLNNADLSHAFMADTDLSRAFLSRVNMTGAKLFGVTLRDARLFDTDMSGTDLGGTNLSGAKLWGVNLQGAEQLDQSQLDTACGRDVKLDPGLTIKPCPPPPQ